MRLGCVAAFGAAALVASAAVAGSTDETGLQLHWAMDELGPCPTVIDSSGNGRNGIAHSNVVGDVSSVFKCLRGFTTPYSSISVTNAVDDVTVWQKDFSFSCWIRNPDMTSTDNHLIARGTGKPPAASEDPDVYYSTVYDMYKKDIGWQLWMTPEGRFVVGLQASGTSTNTLLNAVDPIAPVSFRKDVWYLVTLTVAYEKVSSSVKRRIVKVYLTAEGTGSVGDPLVESTIDFAASLSAKDRSFVVGAGRQGYYLNAAPAGYFNGDICEVKLFSRLLEADDILAEVRSFRHRYHNVDDFAWMHWKLDDGAGATQAADSTGNGHDGILTNGVCGGMKSPNGTAFGGFTNESCFVSTPMTNALDADAVCDISLWVKPPAAFTGTHVLISAAKTLAFRDNPWRVAVTQEGCLSLSMSTYGSYTTNLVSAPLSWSPGEWHHVLIRHDQPKWRGESVTTNDLGVVTTNAVSRDVDHMCVYMTKAVRGTESFEIGDPVVDCTFDFKTGQFSTWQNVVLGAAAAGFYPAFRPAGCWGGLVDDVFITTVPVEDGFYAEMARTYLDAPIPGLLLIFQ